MERKVINQLPDYPQSNSYQPIKATLNNLIDKVNKLEKDKMRDNYLQTFKQISWSIGKCTPNWPLQIEDIALRLKSQLSSFESNLLKQGGEKKGSFLICGGKVKNNSESLEAIYQKILTFQSIFLVIGIYQDRKLKEDLVYNVMNILDQNGAFTVNEKSRVSTRSIKESSIKMQLKEQSKKMCDYCQLMKAVSVCPNGFIAKKLLRELPDVEWIGGMMYEDGKVVDKNLEIAVEFYEKGKLKKNPESLYRLGLLNERGQYGKPFEYLKLWDEAAKLGHLQSMTDLGYLYENGLQEDGRMIIEPNSEKALNYYEKAVAQNFPRALNNLASFYYNDTKYKNTQKCMSYFERAAQAQYVKSLYNLGIIYLQGDLGVPDEVKALRLIKRSAEKGDVQGKQQYVQMMLANVPKCSADDLDEMNMYCRQIIAEQQDNAYAYYFLGIMYEGGYGVPQQPKTALLYYTKATRFDSPQAYMKLGDCYRDGFGVEQSIRDAIQNYQRAAKQIPQANISIGQVYEKGYPQLKQNFQQAFNHYYAACNYEIPQAYEHIANMYRHGRHVKRDESKAEEYFTKAKNARGGKKNFGRMSMSANLIESSYFRGKK